jgi:PD-(D/E)XK nuclease superfamily
VPSQLSTERHVALHLSRFAQSEWSAVVRPWLEAASSRLCRSVVVAPTRGQTHALKRRCAEEGVALLGVEFLTPAMARRRRGVRDDAPRAVKRLLLRARVEARLEALEKNDPARLRWRSLLTDLDAVLDDTEELLRAGLRPRHFPGADVAAVAEEMLRDLDRVGYPVAALDDEAAALNPPDKAEVAVADRLLILAGGPEQRAEFFSLAALARRTRDLTVVVAEPEFAGPGDASEGWVEMWQRLTGVQAVPSDAEDPPGTCAAVYDLWETTGGSAQKAEVIVAPAVSAEMHRVAGQVERWLGAGADAIAVVFPGAGAAHAVLARVLTERGVAFTDHLPSSASAPADIRIQRQIVEFYRGGGRMEALLSLWLMLHALGLVKVSLGEARQACSGAFERLPLHEVGAHLGFLDGEGDPAATEVARVARLLLPTLPEKVTVAQALARVEAARDAFGAAAPTGWSALQEFSRRSRDSFSAAAALEAIASFLPEAAPEARPGDRNRFSRVVLTTPRRAAGICWSHAVLACANDDTWPARRDASCWLTDAARKALNGSGEARFSVGLADSAERSAMERRLFAAIARNTREAVAFSASLHDEEDPETRRAPNSWLERVIASGGPGGPDGFGPFGKVVQEREPLAPADEAEVAHWRGVWAGRRSPGTPFDAYFFSHEPGTGPGALAARQVEQLVVDPAQAWFSAVLRAERVDWRPFERSWGLMLGNAVHAVLAAALRGTPQGHVFAAMPPEDEARARLEAELEARRKLFPQNRYWDSFNRRASWAARELLRKVYAMGPHSHAAVELTLPPGTSLRAGGSRVPVRGRLDLVLSDGPDWRSSSVRVVDYKTGGSQTLSVTTMASKGTALQLAVYLEAALSLGARGSVAMLTPADPPDIMQDVELSRVAGQFDKVARHLSSGVYGALTAERSEYKKRRFEWPLACSPVAHAVLVSKYALTFPGLTPVEVDDEG